jgi:diguanylate cyclase (GGDEF)-like protein/PAS domain S-box-containing protein
MFEITGYTMGEINALGWYQSMYPDPEVQERARARMHRMREGVDLRSERWEITRRNGEKRLVAISTSVLTASDNSVHVLGLMHDFTEEDRLQMQARLARIDDLTQVKNRRGFLESAEPLFKLAARQRQPITLAYLDVDDLKTINDSLGHLEGDRVLKTVATALSGAVRSIDVVGRLGGDEFALVFPGMKASDSRLSIGRLHHRVLETMRGHGWTIGVSMGVASYSISTPEAGEAMSYADALMYEAKKAGKGKVIFGESTGANHVPV